MCAGVSMGLTIVLQTFQHTGRGVASNQEVLFITDFLPLSNENKNIGGEK